MTLGQKLAGYRKLSGLTQQQLGEHLNISAQAISKWEKDLSEPALATLRTLAELYKVSVDELLDLNAGFADASVLAGDDEEENASEPAAQSAPATIGFCKECGLTVTEENLGTTQPVVMCKNCLAEKERREKEAAAEAARKREQAIRDAKLAQEGNRRHRRNHRTLSFCIAGLVTALFIGAIIAWMISDFSASQIGVGIVGSYVVFSFISCLFYDCIVQEVVLDWFDKSLHFPGLIFTFDLDGIAWLIGMKILFWFIGLLFGLLTGILGVLIGMLFAPFVFPFLMSKEHRGIVNGEALED